MARFLRLLLRRRPIAAVALGLLVAISAAAVTAPWLGLPPPDRIEIHLRLRAPAAGHPFGTDNLGRDVLSRVVYSGRVSLPIGVAVMALSTAFGAFVGLLTGYYRKVDNVVTRILEGLMAFPAILLAIGLVAALGFGARNEVIAGTTSKDACHARKRSASSAAIASARSASRRRPASVSATTASRSSMSYR